MCTILNNLFRFDLNNEHYKIICLIISELSISYENSCEYIWKCQKYIVDLYYKLILSL